MTYIAATPGYTASAIGLSASVIGFMIARFILGIGGMAGAIDGMFIAKLVGYILDTTGSYVPIFAIAASAYLVALLIIHLLAPKLEPAKINYEQ